MHFVPPFPNEWTTDDRTQWSEQIESIAKYLFPLVVPASVPEKCFWNEAEQRAIETSFLHLSDVADLQSARWQECLKRKLTET